MIKLKIARGEHAGQPFVAEFVCGLHRAIFDGVRDHAGKHRRDGFGTPRLTFLGLPSPHRDEVESLLTELLSRVRRSLQSLVDNPDDPGFLAGVFRLVAWTHVRLVALQAFEDGNKRTAQLVLDFLLVELGLDTLTFEFCREEYFDTLRSSIESDDPSDFRDLLIRTYGDRIL